MNSLKSLALAVPIAFCGSLANAALVDFGGLAEGTAMGGAFDFGGGLTGTLTSSDLGTNATGEILVCDTKTTGSDCRTNDPDLRSDFSAAATSDRDFGLLDFGNALILEENSGPTPRVDDASTGGRITFLFDTMIDLLEIAILDGADNGPTGASIYLDGVLFASNRGGNDNEYDYVTVNRRVMSFSVDFSGSGAIGEFSATAVPLPGSAVLLIFCVGAIAAARRRVDA